MKALVVLVALLMVPVTVGNALAAPVGAAQTVRSSREVPKRRNSIASA